ncbi:MAG TPA: flagellar hook-basal body complex protein FliE [Coprothermobacter sp.]|nr:flagellar hook-basal body complex protein FliE [Coprothermobacter sp.]
MGMDPVSGIGPIKPINPIDVSKTEKTGQSSDAFSKLLDQLSAKETEQDTYRQAIAQGNMDILPEALVSATEFQVGLLLVTQIRNQLVSAFQEFMRLPL